ncbi:CoA ester lyase [Sphingomonas sp.]|uniref:HpcH/HpaI aldolase/citrate lyase family protein n=1 Tax=Sphingomonas sp. TaxID=28214 RepID=UPI002DEF7F8D|nr:CoA ester lyase [Sphingomonas sp.]
MTRGTEGGALAARMQSLLFVPGSRPDRFSSALASGADAACIDLEDAVPPDAKEEARRAALDALGDTPLALRINALSTDHGQADLDCLGTASCKPALLLLPKVEDAAEIAPAAALDVGLVPLIETPRGLRRAHEIAAVPGVVAMMFGGGDLSAELGVDLAWEPLAVARGIFVLACAEAGIPAIDVPYLHLDDDEGLAAETSRAQALGFTAKAAIHPKQIATIHRVLRPSAEQIAEARAAEAAFQAAGGAAVRWNGRMLEAPVMRRYRRILEQEQAHA